MASQAFCLRWNNFQSNLLNVFDRLFQDEQFTDVTLACEGKLIKAHKMVLSASSSYFQEIFATNPCPHPVVIMKDVPYADLKQILEFMYKGEINVQKNDIAPLLVVAEAFKIRGLAQTEEIEPQPSTSKGDSVESRANNKVKRLMKRTRNRESSIDSLVLIEDGAEKPIKQRKIIKAIQPKESPIMFAQDDSECENIDNDDDMSENVTEFDPIAIESVQSIKTERVDDIFNDYSNLDNGVSFYFIQLHFICIC